MNNNYSYISHPVWGNLNLMLYLLLKICIFGQNTNLTPNHKYIHLWSTNKYRTQFQRWNRFICSKELIMKTVKEMSNNTVKYSLTVYKYWACGDQYLYIVKEYLRNSIIILKKIPELCKKSIKIKLHYDEHFKIKVQFPGLNYRCQALNYRREESCSILYQTSYGNSKTCEFLAYFFSCK